MEQNAKNGHDRRSFLTNMTLSTGVLTLGLPMVTGGVESAAAAEGKYDFDTPYNRIGTDSVKWDSVIRSENMTNIVAGMGIADLDFKCAPAITAALRKRITHENWGYLDMGSPGPTAFKQGLIDWNRKRYGITNINPSLMGISTGVHDGIIATMKAYCPPGSKVLMATPIYNGFYGDVKVTNTVAEESLMKFTNGRYEIDWEDFERRMTPDVKVSILCNPQNPVGRAWTKEELTKYGELCLKHKIIVLSDEIHCDFISKGQKYTPFSSLDNKDVVNNSITYKSASKSFSLAGMKCAWFFTTNPEIFKVTAANNRASLNTLGMISMQAAYAGGGDWMTQCASYLSDNQDFLNSYIKSNIPMIKVGNRQEATYLGWLDTTQVADRIGAKKMADEANKTAEDAAAKMGTDYSGAAAMVTRTKATPELMVEHWFAKNANVQINPGTSFGLGGQNHMRMNIGTSRKTLKAALDSMSASLKKLG